MASTTASASRPVTDSTEGEVSLARLYAPRTELGGRLRSANPRKPISIRLPTDVIERWKATGPGWQTRIAARLSKVR